VFSAHFFRIGAVFSVLLVIFLFFFSMGPLSCVCLRDSCLRVELALTPEQQERGLMFRPRLPQGRGMLFVMPKEDFWSFWMKNTTISLDIIWIDSNGVVVDIVKAAQPSKAALPPSFKPLFAARYVLEANAGFADAHHVRIGDKARFKWIFSFKKI
jgi:uncharacterized membrane protein (UPF0127 family)